jgi:hypothetical protein
MHKCPWMLCLQPIADKRDGVGRDLAAVLPKERRNGFIYIRKQSMKNGILARF